MNSFMYLSKRNFSNDIKALYPKCVNCINFNRTDNSCKKFIIQPNFVNYDTKNVPCAIVRNDDTKCGEIGRFFDIGALQLEKDKKEKLNISCGLGLSTGVLSGFLDSSSVPVLTFFSLSVISWLSFIDASSNYEKIVKGEKERLEKLAKINNI